MTVHDVPETDSNRFVTISKTKRDGFPVYNQHTLAESWPSLERAKHAAQIRGDQGYWVDVYEEKAYDTGAPRK